VCVRSVLFCFKYDTGRLRPGGRASSRQSNDPSKDDKNSNTNADFPILSRFRFDHAAQFITSTSTATSSSSSAPSWRTDFDQQVENWVDQGILRTAPPDSIYVFKKKKNSKPPICEALCLNPAAAKSTTVDDIDKQQQNFYYPHEGMSSLVGALTSGNAFQVKQDVWVSPSSGVKYQGPPAPLGCTSENTKATDNWNVRALGKTIGKHDHLIVAHNGKCADRLMSKTPAKDVHNLLRVNFNDRVPANGGQKMTLNSLYSLTLCLKGPSILSQSLQKSESFIAGFVQDHPRLGLVTCQTNKYPTTTYNKDNDDDDDDSNNNNFEVWTIISTAQFAKKYKAPQENLPEDVIENVTKLLVDSLQEDIIGNNNNNSDGTTTTLQSQVVESRLQLWGAAVPLNVWRGDPSNDDKKSDDSGSSGFIYDPRYQVGVCGDWLLEPSIAGAWTSGRQLAQHLIDASSDKDENENSSKSESVGFPKGYFEASQAVKKLGIAALDGPIQNNDNQSIPQKSRPAFRQDAGSYKGSKNNQNRNRKTSSTISK
jgi:hypothetical protein